ncbi:MAG: hypothetical protein QF486_04305 [Candidatus Woesearchaeota archaeon]|jgi:hypothetical protein|nr:hypothetical protein [Candidatus Woesearchaeota archaeon]MDP7181724.1 hypothetical protein [Candidatus Woesearchaeota archaeon]MDP7198813.1 hypothetical protein [Candidatus Woesearchaeota archaeon]MDP7467187.1 hypothetical protein [Candidatus Woesearchaeota archaeon]MDP7647478.1 hypothetical protein [Candidatus Woesearchaeota archaeon]
MRWTGNPGHGCGVGLGAVVLGVSALSRAEAKQGPATYERVTKILDAIEASPSPETFAKYDAAPMSAPMISSPQGYTQRFVSTKNNLEFVCKQAQGTPGEFTQAAVTSTRQRVNEHPYRNGPDGQGLCMLTGLTILAVTIWHYWRGQPSPSVARGSPTLMQPQSPITPRNELDL